MNDIYNASNKLEFVLYANKLSLNVKKTHYIIFHPYQKRLNYGINIKIFDSCVNKYFNLERKEYVKYLGAMIDNHLSWKHHINYVALKMSRNIGIVSKLRHFVPPKTLYGIYNSLIFPFLWPGASKPQMLKVREVCSF